MTLLRISLSTIVILALLVLAGSPAAAAAEVPLSMPPSAPLPGAEVLGVGLDGAEISLLMASQERLFVQKLTADGAPIDPVATPVELIPSFSTSFAWTGERWIAARRNGTTIQIAWIDPDGTSTPWHETGVRSVIPALRPAGGRMFLLAVDSVPEPIETYGLRVFEIDAAGNVTPRSDRSVTRLVRGMGVVELNQGAFPISWDLDYPSPERPLLLRVHGAGDHAQLSIPGESSIDFHPGTDPGGLALWYQDGPLRGSTLDGNGVFSQPFTLGLFDAQPHVRVAATDEGWVVFAGSWNGPLRMFEVTATGSVRDRGEISGGGEYFRGARILPVGSEVLFFSAAPAGITVERLVGNTAVPVASAGRARAAQFDARTAEGPGIDLAVWSEQADGGRVLRAGRVIPGGNPLDGAGILLSEPIELTINASAVFDVVWDGHTFAVVWARPAVDGRDVVLRRVGTDGMLLDAEPVVIATSQSSSLGPLRLAAAGDGRSAVAWNDDAAGVGIFLAAIADGVPGEPVVVTEDSYVNGPAIAWDGTRYVVVWDDLPPCQILCPYFADLYARAFSLDGAPTGPPVLVKAGGGISPQLVRAGGHLITLAMLGDPASPPVPGLAILEDDFTLSPLATGGMDAQSLIRGGEGEILVEHRITRSVYSLSGALLRTEPLPIGPKERVVAPLRDRSIVLTPAGPDRLVVRDAVTARGDLAVVAGQHPIQKDGSWWASFTLQNRGTTPITRVELSSHFPTQGSGQHLVVEEMEIAPGESTMVLVSTYLHEGVLTPVTLRARPDVIDETPENNVATFDGEPPAGRRRAVSRR